MWSTTASDWGSSILNRALKSLGVKPRDARVATAMLGRGTEGLTGFVVSIPGASKDSLWAVVPIISDVPEANCRMRDVAGKNVRWCEHSQLTFKKASWAVDGMVLWVSAADSPGSSGRRTAAQRVEAAISQLP
jgi:hypothetical protein